MDTVSGGVSVGPGKVTLSSDSWSPSSGIEGEFEHDLGDPNRMGPGTLPDTSAGAGIDDVRSVRLV